MFFLRRYMRWLHTRWPAGKVESLPEVAEDGATSVEGVYVAGDLTGVPLLKLAADSGSRAIARIASDLLRSAAVPGDELDLVIVGGGVAGVAAALEATRRGLRFELCEAAEPFFTIANFPKQKPIFTYPAGLRPQGELQFREEVHPKETLLADLREQMTRAKVTPRAAKVDRIERAGDRILVHIEGAAPLRARRVLIAIGRSGAFRKLAVPGEDLPKVYNRLHDPAEFSGKRALVVGGGDTAVETAIALAQGGADVTLSYRAADLSRPKPDNLEKLRALMADPMAPVAIEEPTSERVTTSTGGFTRRGVPGRIATRPGTRIREIRPDEVVIDAPGGQETLHNDVVFAMIGREAPLPFFRRSGMRIAGEMTRRRWVGMGLFLFFCVLLYDWKAGGHLADLFAGRGWLPFPLAEGAQQRGPLLRALSISAATPSFWYTLCYSLVVVIFGARRIRRRKTPYVTAQTLTLMAVQVLPLFLLPEVILPWLHYRDLLPASLADALFPLCNYGHGREFWRAYGFVLAWPLMIYNVFTHQPLWTWLFISLVQTAVLIPVGIRYFGKGFYCGWICSCGALAETLGDAHRQKMPHGPRWNRLNLAGQVILGIAVLLLIVRVMGWILPAGNWIDQHFASVLEKPYKWIVDVTLGGVVGVGFYFWFSGRVWCRFFCPLAALMHIYARFSRFAIVPDKKKCISCNVCTSVCHQGIDVMNFANKGLPMVDPECVRCSACVQSCPTDVLTFGRLGKDGAVVSVDRLRASALRAS